MTPRAETTPGASPAGPDAFGDRGHHVPRPGWTRKLRHVRRRVRPKGAVSLFTRTAGSPTTSSPSPDGSPQAATRPFSGPAVVRGRDVESRGRSRRSWASSANCPKDLVAEMQAALDELAEASPTRKIGVIGFCFGGGMVWQLVKSGGLATRRRRAVLRHDTGPAAPTSRTRMPRPTRSTRSCTHACSQMWWRCA